MTDPSNNAYAFPLQECKTHTFQSEDGEQDTCYRCGAARPAVGSRVAHKGTGELGTVTEANADDLGALATVEWDNTDALELPNTLHAKHLDVVTDLEAVRDDELISECHRRGLPGTMAELADEAKRQGIQPSRLVQLLTGSYDWAFGTAGADK